MRKRIPALLLALAMICTLFPGLSAAAAGTVMTFYGGVVDTVAGSGKFDVAALNDDTDTYQSFDYTIPEDGATVLIFFRGDGGCYNSTTFMRSLAASSLLTNEKVHIVAVESYKTPKAEVSAFVENTLGSKAQNVDIYYNASTNILFAAYNTWVLNSSNYAFPIVLIVTEWDGQKSVDYAEGGMTDASVVKSYVSRVVSDVDDSSDNRTVTVTVSGVQDYDEANEVFRLMNEERTANGLSKLSMNTALTEIAMQRAAELAVYYSHTRPDGTECFSAAEGVYAGYTALAENIAMGQTSASQVMTSWMNSSGHRANILNGKLTQVGVGCFEYGGTLYWVQFFGNSTSLFPNSTETGRKAVDAQVLTLDSSTDTHTHTYADSVVAPTCTTQGYTTHTCSICGASYRDTYTAATGHTWGAWTVTTPATENAAGIETRVCQVCGEEETREIPALGHTHSLSHKSASAAACTTSGNIEYWYCAVCGKYFSDNGAKNEIRKADTVAAALGHNYKASVTAPTCTEKGYTTHTCTRCGDSYVDTYVNAAGHKTTVKNAKQATCTEKGYTGDEVCTVCGETVKKGSSIPAKGHTWGAWVSNKDATTEKDGTKTRTCSACGETETVTDAGSKLPAPVVTNPFTDLKNGAYYVDAVLWAYKNGVTAGTTATTFSPEASCTRAQVVSFLWRAAGSPKPTSTNNPFTDVKAGAYYYDAVLWAAEKGITAGTTATTFSPNARVTRSQFVTFLYRFAGSPDMSGTKNPFNDLNTKAFYYNAVLWAAENGITAGTSATTFSPEASCTRGQVVAFLYRYYS